MASHVATIVLNRPEALNAWTRQLGDDMLAALEQAAAEPEVRVVVFTGAGRAFSSGADLKNGELGPDGRLNVLGPLRESFNPLIARVRTVPKPVIAKVNGPAVGIGCSLALAADLVVAAETAYFLLAFVNIGLGLDGGASLTLPLRGGHARAFEMAYLGERIPAARALEWGLVNQVVADDQLGEAVASLARSAVGSRTRRARDHQAAPSTRGCTPGWRRCSSSRPCYSRSGSSRQISSRAFRPSWSAENRDPVSEGCVPVGLPAMNLATILTESAQRYPDRVAVKLDDIELTYRLLDGASTHLAGLLHEKGFSASDRVGIMLPNVPYFPVCYFGVLRAGGVVVPMNVLLKRREVAFYLRDSGTRAVFCLARFRRGCAGGRR